MTHDTMLQGSHLSSDAFDALVDLLLLLVHRQHVLLDVLRGEPRLAVSLDFLVHFSEL